MSEAFAASPVVETALSHVLSGDTLRAISIMKDKLALEGAHEGTTGLVRSAEKMQCIGSRGHHLQKAKKYRYVHICRCAHALESWSRRQPGSRGPCPVGKKRNYKNKTNIIDQNNKKTKKKNKKKRGEQAQVGDNSAQRVLQCGRLPNIVERPPPTHDRAQHR